MSLILRQDINRKMTAQELDQNFTFLLSQITQTGSGATGPSMTDITYLELTQLIGSQSLTPGTFYQITDFRTAYDQPDYDFLRSATYSQMSYKQADIEPIVVLAISNDNTIINRDLFDNWVGNRAEGNEILGDFEENFIWGFNFQFNRMYELFDENHIATNFQDNILIQSFQDSKIGKDFGNNALNIDFSGNDIQGDFWDNKIKGFDFRDNKISQYFEVNDINVEDFTSNNISTNFISNNITDEVVFNFNHVNDNFTNNEISIEFEYNQVAGGIDNLSLIQGASPSVPSVISDSVTTQIVRDESGDILMTWLQAGSMTFSVIG